jgi:hypothetical protein
VDSCVLPAINVWLVLTTVRSSTTRSSSVSKVAERPGFDSR